MADVDRLIPALEEAFNAVIVPSNPRPFGSGPLKIRGFHDGNIGVQWNTWIEWRHLDSISAFLGVNLEGMRYRDWPIAKLIQHELEEPRLLDTRDWVQHPEEIRVGFQRDAWQAAARVPRFKEQDILPQTCVLGELSMKRWNQALIEAQECLASEEGGRARHTITLTDGRTVERAVSPHLNFHQQLTFSSNGQDFQQAMIVARQELQPLYDFVSERST